MEPRLPRRALLLLALGLLLRVVALPAWGTLDVEIQKAWAGRAATGGLADMYGPPDSDLLQRAREQGRGPLSVLLQPQPRAWFDWRGHAYFVDYPPASLLVLWAAGRLYLQLAPELDRELLFNAAVNLAPLLGSVLITALLWRSFQERGGGPAGSPCGNTSWTSGTGRSRTNASSAATSCASGARSSGVRSAPGTSWRARSRRAGRR